METCRVSVGGGAASGTRTVPLKSALPKSTETAALALCRSPGGAHRARPPLEYCDRPHQAWQPGDQARTSSAAVVALGTSSSSQASLSSRPARYSAIRRSRWARCRGHSRVVLLAFLMRSLQIRTRFHERSRFRTLVSGDADSASRMSGYDF